MGSSFAIQHWLLMDYLSSCEILAHASPRRSKLLIPCRFQWVAEDTVRDGVPLAETQKTAGKGGKNKDQRHILAILVSRHLGVLSECNERARERHSIICDQEFVTYSKQQRAELFIRNDRLLKEEQNGE